MSDTVKPGDIFRYRRMERYHQPDVYFAVVEKSGTYKNSWVIVQVGNIDKTIVQRTWERQEALLDICVYDRVA